MEKIFAKEKEFIDYIKELFICMDYVVESNQQVFWDEISNKIETYDLCVRKGDETYFVEVRYSSSGKIGKSILHEAAQKHLLSSNKYIHVIIISNTITHEFTNVHLQVSPKTVYFLNLIDLFYIVKNDEPMREKLVGLLEFSVEEVLHLAEDEENLNMECIKSLSILPLIHKNTDVKKYIDKLSTWNQKKKYGKKYAREYENLCYKVLKYLFNNELTSWSPQKKSNNDIYIFDLICRIKDNTNSEFWDMLERYFDTKYIIFEFKNYTNAISQKEIYTTEKYLYDKALRKVAIVISCNGAHSHAKFAAKGILRENGKLILDITNDELLQMIEMKLQGNYPSDYLMLKMDEFMKTLEK